MFSFFLAYIAQIHLLTPQLGYLIILQSSLYNHKILFPRKIEYRRIKNIRYFNHVLVLKILKKTRKLL